LNRGNNKQFHDWIAILARRLGLRIFIFIVIALSGFCSSVISVIVTSVILAEIMSALDLQRKKKVEMTVITCSAAGLGAVLTPLGEPLSAIATAKLFDLLTMLTSFSWPEFWVPT